MAAHAERAHARLAPSASKRWMECPGSVRLSDPIPQTSSIFADEGTAAHELASYCLVNGYGADRFSGWSIDLNAKTDKTRFLKEAPEHEDRVFEADDEMVDGVQVYLDHVRSQVEPGDEMDVEFRFDLQHISEGMFGTGDCVIYKPKSGELIVIDLKYGRGVVVEPENNPQLLCYGLGAVRRHGNRPMTTVRLEIVQPRCSHPKGSVRGWTTHALDLLDFEVDLRAAAGRTQDSNAPLKAGDWCGFCPAAAICPAVRAKAVATAGLEFEVEGNPPEGMTPGELSAVLEEVETIEKWCIRVKKYAHDEAVAGRPTPGWKLVAKRATRKWKDEDEAGKLLRLDFDLGEDDLYAKKMRGPAQMEKFMPGRNKEARAAVLAPLVKKESSGLVLVLATDARPPAHSGGSEFEEE